MKLATGRYPRASAHDDKVSLWDHCLVDFALARQSGELVYEKKKPPPPKNPNHPGFTKFHMPWFP